MAKRMMAVDLSGKNALVTGGAKGIGEAISKSLAASRANLAINYNTSAQRAKSLVEQFRANGLRVVAIQADVSQSDQAERLVSQAPGSLGRHHRYPGQQCRRDSSAVYYRTDDPGAME